MKKILWQSCVFAILSCTFSSSFAATRTIQFVGSVMNRMTLLNLLHYRNDYYCSVTIVNTGDTNQRVTSIAFNTPALSGQNMLSTAPDHAEILQGAGSGTACFDTPGSGCTGIDIVPGGAYIAGRDLGVRVFDTQNHNICAGRFTVEDSDANAPGSMVASGSMTYAAEQGLTGGQFSGALYYSGSFSHKNWGIVASTTGGGKPRMGSDGSAGSGSGSVSTDNSMAASYNMNMYCANSCYASVSSIVIPSAPAGINSWRRIYCNAVCGMSEASYDNQSFLNGNGGVGPDGPHMGDPIRGAGQGGGLSSVRNFGGWLEEMDPSAGDATVPAGGGSAGAANRDNLDGGLRGVPFHDNSRINSKFRGMIRNANPRFAGGRVIEMIVGPFDSICSGNMGYWRTDNPNRYMSPMEFDHGDGHGVDAGLIQYDAANSTFSGTAPPERLFCAHNHRRPHPFGYSWQGVPFTINGGLPF